MNNDEIKQINERLKKLEEAVFNTAVKETNTKSNAFDFSLNERAFLKKYSSNFNGQQSFALICAYLAQGRKDVEIALSKIKDIWMSCAGVIGCPYSSIFSTRAKENGWVDVMKEKKGSYLLGKNWQDIF